MNNLIARQRCKHHRGREASVKCTSCGYFFCGECCADHDGRLLCRACLESLVKDTAGTRRSRAGSIVFTGGVFAGFLTLWMLLFFFGDLLSSIPDSWFAARAETDFDRAKR